MPLEVLLILFKKISIRIWERGKCGFVIFWCWLRSSVKVWWQCGSVLCATLWGHNAPISAAGLAKSGGVGRGEEEGAGGAGSLPLIPIHLSPILRRLTILSTALLRHCVLLPLNGVVRLKGLGVALHQSAGQCLVSHCPPCILERAAPPKLPHSRHCADTNPVSQHHTELATILSVLEYFWERKSLWFTLMPSLERFFGIFPPLCWQKIIIFFPDAFQILKNELTKSHLPHSLNFPKSEKVQLKTKMCNITCWVENDPLLRFPRND